MIRMKKIWVVREFVDGDGVGQEDVGGEGGDSVDEE